MTEIVRISTPIQVIEINESLSKAGIIVDPEDIEFGHQIIVDIVEAEQKFLEEQIDES